MNTSRHARCTAQLPGRGFCDAASLPGAPFPMCERHMIQAAKFVMEMRMSALPGVRGSAPRKEGPSKIDQRKASIVYYIDWGNDQVKIGRTTNLTRRLNTFSRRTSDILALEVGATVKERERHVQFREERVPRSEIFNLSPRLRDHIEAVQSGDAGVAVTVEDTVARQNYLLGRKEPLPR